MDGGIIVAALGSALCDDQRVLCREVILWSERHFDLLPFELGLSGLHLVGRHDMGVLFVESPLVHLSVVDIETSRHFAHRSQIPRLNAICRQVGRS